MKSIVIFSGGLDSTVAVAHMLDMDFTVKTLTFDYGSKHAKKEIAAAKSIAEVYKVENTLIKLSFIRKLFESNLLSGKYRGDIPDGDYKDRSMKTTVVPFRNGIMLSIAIGYAASIGFDTVVIGSHSGDHEIYPDCRPAFTEMMGEASCIGTYEHIFVLAPFMNFALCRLTIYLVCDLYSPT